MNSGGRPWRAAILGRRRLAAAGRARRLLHQLAAAAADPGGRGDRGAAELGDDLLDRPARRRLDDHEVDHHDPEQGRDDQQQPADDVGQHAARRSSRSRLTVAARAPPSMVSPLRSAATLSSSIHHANRSRPIGRDQYVGPAELVPVGEPVDLDLPVRDHVVAPQQHPIERLGARSPAPRACRRCDDRLDQHVDGRVLDAGEVAAARRLGGLRAPVVALLVARRSALPPEPEVMSKSKLSVRF